MKKEIMYNERATGGYMIIDKNGYRLSFDEAVLQKQEQKNNWGAWLYEIEKPEAKPKKVIEEEKINPADIEINFDLSLN